MLDTSARSRITEILDASTDVTLATLRDDGYPQATTVSYVNDGLAIYFVTGAEAQKARNIAGSDKISATIDLPYEDWAHIRGLSLAGHASRLTETAEIEKLGALMIRKFPEAARLAEADLGESAYFRIDPKVVSVLDYRQGFGHTDLYRI